ncbi:MAG: SRPBCC family protein [Pseudomonadota bacterium]
MNQHASEQDLQLGKWIAGAALGAAVMYLLDPDRGAPRRAESGRKLRELGRQTGDVLDKVVANLGARMGEASSVDSSSETQRSDTLQGTAIQAMPEPSRQSGERWSGGMRGAAMASGGALGLYGLLSTRSPLGLAFGLAGLTLLARGASNRPLRSMLGSAGQAQAVDVEKTIRIDAAPEQVYDLFANYENFPRFMSNVVEVRDLGNQRSHWVVKGPAGTEFAWNAVLTEHDRPRRLCWKSEPGAEVEQSGEIRFEPFRNGTRVTVHMSYRPPAGAVGHVLASLLGSDPKRQLDEDLARMKALVERGAMPHAAATQGDAEGKFLH